MEGQQRTSVYGRMDVIHTDDELNTQGCYNLIQAILAPMFRRAENGDWKALGYIQSEDAEHWGKLVCRDAEAWRRYVDNWLRDMLVGNHS